MCTLVRHEPQRQPPLERERRVERGGGRLAVQRDVGAHARLRDRVAHGRPRRLAAYALPRAAA